MTIAERKARAEPQARVEPPARGSSLARQAGSAAGKLIAVLAVAVFALIGIAGLVLPIIPGLLFLAIAAVIAARHSPAFERVLRKNGRIGGYLDGTRRFQRLSIGRKVQVGALLCLKAVVDAADWVASAIGKHLGSRTH